jgi:hypothetical protein
MHKYTITGKFQPEQRIQDLDIHTKFGLKHEEFNVEGDIEMKVIGSDIELVYTTETNHSQPDTANLETLKNILIEEVRLIINVFGYTDSFYLDVYLLNIKCEELNINWDFGIKGEYNINRNEQERKAEFDKIMSLFKGKDYSRYSWLKDSFADFHNAIKYPAQTAQYCFRAIEIIRQNYYEDITNTDNDTRRNDGWRNLRTELNYTRQDFNEIERFGLPNRHGQYPAITYEVRKRIMNFTRQLIDRFVDKRLGEQ